MEQNWIYIYTVYKKRSFSKAAKELFITQPALSIAIQKVEKEIGMPLFDRNKKRLELTDAGKIFIEKINEIQELENELDMCLNDLSQSKTGRLHIGGTHYLNSYIFPPVLARFQAKWPGIQLSLTEAGSFEMLTMLREHEIDLTLNSTASANDAFDRIPAFCDTILLAVPCSCPENHAMREYAFSAADIVQNRHMKKGGPAVDLKAFATVPFILLTEENNLYYRCHALFAENQIKPYIYLQVSQLVTAYHLARSGLGATFTSSRLVAENHDTMYYYKINSPLSFRIFDITTCKGRYKSNAAKAFIQLFQEYYADTMEGVL